MNHLSMKQLYGLASQWALEQGPDLPHGEITTRVSAITDYLDFGWKHKWKALSKQSDPQNWL